MRIAENLLLLSLVACCLMPAGVRAERIKDLAAVHGVRRNQLIGYGLVTGLNGTGDSYRSRFTLQSLAAMLGRMGVRIDPKQIQVRNVAAVMVSAELPPFARTGSRIDVTVSSIGDARSLLGGTLIYTPLRGSDGNVYAVAQGALAVGGWDTESYGARLSKNHATVGRIPMGATVEKEVPSPLTGADSLDLTLLQPDFTTAARLAAAINTKMGSELAQALDAGTVRVKLPQEGKTDVVSLLAEIENLEVAGDNRARVVVSERTGTVVLGEQVRLRQVAITHGSIHLEIAPRAEVSQPNPLAAGNTVTVREDQIRVREPPQPLVVVEPGATLGELVRALNAVGATPRDLIQILQAIHSAGALPAELEII